MRREGDGILLCSTGTLNAEKGGLHTCVTQAPSLEGSLTWINICCHHLEVLNDF